jgi:glutathione S-transferase
MKLYYFPLSTYSQKAQVAFYEKEISFEAKLVNLQDQEERKQYREVYPIGKVPLLIVDDATKSGHMIPESSIIVEYLDGNFSSGTELLPKDPNLSRKVRFHDRMYDLYLNESVSTLIFQGWKDKDQRDQEGIDEARRRIDIMYKFMEMNHEKNTWANGEVFSLADCATVGPLFYAQKVHPFDQHKNIRAYFQRLLSRTSIQKVIEEAKPFMENVKMEMV